MTTYDFYPVFNPQFVPDTDAAALTFATPGAGVAVPANYKILISHCTVANVSADPVNLSVWRVPSGDSADPAHLLCLTIPIPPATEAIPWFNVDCLWGAVLEAGDAIWALAGTASALVIQGDGAAGSTS